MMHRLQLIALVLMAALGAIKCGVAPPAGKCRDLPETCQPVPVNLDALAGLGEWEILLSANYDFYKDVDRELRDVTPITEHIYRVDDKRILKDNSNTDYTFIIKYYDFIVHEYAYENGESRHYKIFPIAITKNNGVLYYRCSDSGEPGVDVRIVEKPRGSEISEEEEQYLIAADKSCNFIGDLTKLPKAKHYSNDDKQ